MNKFSMLLPVLLPVILLAGCAQTTYWAKSGGTTGEFDRAQAACHNQAFFLPKVQFETTETGYLMNTQAIGAGFYTSTITPYKAPYQNLADGFFSMSAAFEEIGRKEIFIENCMVANGWTKVDEAAVALTVSVYARIGPDEEVYEGTATGYPDHTGTMKLKNATGNGCVGSFRYISDWVGNGSVIPTSIN